MAEWKEEEEEIWGKYDIKFNSNIGKGDTKFGWMMNEKRKWERNCDIIEWDGYLESGAKN